MATGPSSSGVVGAGEVGTGGAGGVVAAGVVTTGGVVTAGVVAAGVVAAGVVGVTQLGPWPPWWLARRAPWPCRPCFLDGPPSVTTPLFVVVVLAGVVAAGVVGHGTGGFVGRLHATAVGTATTLHARVSRTVSRRDRMVLLGRAAEWRLARDLSPGVNQV